MKKKEIVIIGAGPAGLTTAYYLLKNSNEYSVTILERDNIIGGISKTIEFDGYRIDTGIHRFFTKNDEIEKIWEECLPIQGKPAYDDILLQREKEFRKGGPNPEKQDKTMLIKDRITRIYYGRKFYDYPVTLNMTTIKNMGFLTMTKAGFSYLKSCIHKLPETSLENFYINRFGKVLYQMFFESYTEKVWGINPSKISADWGAQRVKGLSIAAVIKDMIKKIIGKKNDKTAETSLIERFIYPKLGAGQVYEEMANKIRQMGGKIILNADVKEILFKNKKVESITYYQNNKKHQLNVDILVSSMPLKELFTSIHGMTIPKDIYEIATNLPYRSFMSVGLVVDKLYLENTTKVKTLNEIIPDSWIYVQEPDVKMGRLQVFNNWSPYLFRHKEEINNKVLFTLEYFCDEFDDYWNMSDEEFIDFAIEEALKLKMISSKKAVEKSVRIKVPKAYPAYFGTYSQIDKVINYVNGFDNVYCVGRNGQHRYNNMDHSMLTGIETAKHILDNHIDKKEIWNVNVEKEYHEEKKS